MKKGLKITYNILRLAVVTVLVSVVTLFAALYLALSIPAVHDKIKGVAEDELSKLLTTDVSIGELTIMPFNEVVLKDVAVPTQEGDSLFTIDKLGTSISLFHLLNEQRLVFNYAEVIGLKGRIVKPDPDSPTNMQFLIDAFKPKDNKPPKPFDVVIDNVVLRKIDVSYDLLSAPRKQDRLDPNHLHVRDLRADVTLPRLKNNDFVIDVKRLAMNEKSGLELKNLKVLLEINDTTAAARGLIVELPKSMVSLGDVEVHYSSLKTIGQDIKNTPLELKIADSYVALPDIVPLVPALKGIDETVHLTAVVAGTSNDVDVRMLSLHDGKDRLTLNTSGRLNNLNDKSQAKFNVPNIQLKANGNDIEELVSRFAKVSPQAAGIIKRCGDVEIDGSANGNLNLSNAHFNGDISTSLGAVALNGLFAQQGSNRSFKGHVSTQHFGVGPLIDKTDLLGEVALDLDLDAHLASNTLSHGKVDGVINYVDFKGYRYHNIDADFEGGLKDFNGKLAINDPAVQVNVDGNVHLDGAATAINAEVSTKGLNLARLGLVKGVPDGNLTLAMNANVTGNSLDNLNGQVEIHDINYNDAHGRNIRLDHIVVNADNSSAPQSIMLDTDYLRGNIYGTYNFATLVPTVKGMLSTAFPQFFGQYASVLNRSGKKNNFDFNFELNPTDEFNNMVKLPVKFITKTTIDGSIDEAGNAFAVNVKAPYLLNGKSIIEGTDLSARLDSAAGNVSLVAHTLLPMKQGKAAVTINANGINDRLDTDLAWKLLRESDFHGNLNLSTLLRRNDEGKIKLDIDVNPTQLVFNGTPWQVDPAKVTVDNNVITVDGMCGHNNDQFIKINGVVSKNPDDELCLDLNDVSLDYVFETLNIDNVTFGGQATGKFYASNLFTKSPRIYTPVLHVDDLSYNHSVMGDADIKSRWLNDEKAVELDADLSQKNGEHSNIKGGIFIADDSLHLTFDANRANIGFMKPYMQAFTSDVAGEVSGHAVLLGNFHTINLYGDVVADSLKFKLDYTNVYYTCAGDSVHMKPNLITFDNVNIHDREGHSAKMNGWLKHDAFHDPVFNFSITNAKNLLCYDTNADINPVWYGTVYGNGSAFVTGEPGIVDIKVNMQSAPNSKFTFVLSDAMEANEYTFITFRDRNKPEVEPDTVVTEEEDDVPEIVKQLRAQRKIQEQGPPTAYTIDLQGDITPDAQLVIVMDPVGGDRIKATGRGNMRLTYNNNDEMTMFGKYTLEKGDYNFTLQDIIIKDFTIRDGSSISFQGDPYAALLDIEAVYSLNANLRDLDQTFANDKEITRTNVPVHALLRAKGPMSQPDISFDLEFPTLTSDAYRRVKSIISTDDMMNRQIIYLLALNRFYTPEYMGGTSQNNELTSVASSTISSQLSSMLGKMSENWSISPNVRSDRGDFSDVEVDVALSSQLLNNRLLFNGNFGYRDNTYNTRNSNFIGDFDIEYLLNRNGSLRLKAYNHFNDQNYYVRNALTTQGVGIVWKHDFDRPLDFIIPRRKLKLDTDSTATDSAKTDKTAAQ